MTVLSDAREYRAENLMPNEPILFTAGEFTGSVWVPAGSRAMYPRASGDAAPGDIHFDGGLNHTAA